MRVIFKSPSRPVTMKDPRDGSLHDGDLHFELFLCDEGEDPTPPDADQIPRAPGTLARRVPKHTLRELRGRAAGGPIEIRAPEAMIGGVPVIIPDLVLSALPDTAAFVLQWELTPRAAQ